MMETALDHTRIEDLQKGQAVLMQTLLTTRKF